MAQIVADVLELPVEAFTLHHGSTTLVEFGYGTYHSRAVVVGGSALHLAGEKLLFDVEIISVRDASAEELSHGHVHGAGGHHH